ncbi:hypothetical protein [Xanthomonas cannabis]|uniref:Uncharacterized protein n=1 Tax=Xanthomonas cannabis TaxID=1885674 RepID=A0ABR6JKT3_9XANT|nr:hypothetical protein [Xanthomonas cannabis]MBB4593397.1 hypothetical protein [Xanthomonas cannabis]MBB5523052.1 hypothetical protein [Xanthomonas cannabis]
MKETSTVRTVRDGCVPALLSAAMDKHTISAPHMWSPHAANRRHGAKRMRTHNASHGTQGALRELPDAAAPHMRASNKRQHQAGSSAINTPGARANKTPPLLRALHRQTANSKKPLRRLPEGLC